MFINTFESVRIGKYGVNVENVEKVPDRRRKHFENSTDLLSALFEGKHGLRISGINHQCHMIIYQGGGAEALFYQDVNFSILCK